MTEEQKKDKIMIEEEKDLAHELRKIARRKCRGGGGRSEPKACALGTGQFWSSTEEGVDRKSAYRYAFTVGRGEMKCLSRTRTPTRMGTRVLGACARVELINNSINNKLKLKQSERELRGEYEGGLLYPPHGGALSPFLTFGFVLRNKPVGVPEDYALWWTKFMKDRDYMLSDGKKITRLNWRKNLLAFYKRGYRDEMSDARDWYERWRERYYVQEATPRTVWEEKCRGI